jgi:nitrite reductase/ring-hydroxylating ferredoxin subunit/uncharacterized membrane protein
MKSRASIKSHPLHPILVTFPIAFFTGAFLFDLLSVVLRYIALQQTAYYLCIAGIAGGIAAAIAGAVDYVHTVPPKSSAKKRATRHAILNSLNLVLFIAVLFYRRGGGVNETLVIVLEAIGVVVLSFAGWLGGTLVYRNQIGVDIRYAAAGKWKEISISETDEWVEVGTAEELKVDQMKLVQLKEKRIVIANTGDGFAAFDDRCTHKGGSLAGGTMICGTVQCPWHGSQFMVKTGALQCGPSTEGIRVYPLEIRNGKLFLKHE